MNHGSILAILDNGKHRTATGTFARHEDFHEFVRDTLRADRYHVRTFYYAWGCETQEYTPNEVLEVYFGE